MHAAPQSKRRDLVYHEQKLHSFASPDGSRRDECQRELPRSVVRQPNNPLDIAVGRLAELQRNIEQRCPHRLLFTNCFFLPFFLAFNCKNVHLS